MVFSIAEHAAVPVKHGGLHLLLRARKTACLPSHPSFRIDAGSFVRSICCVMERPKLRRPDAYHVAEPAWLPRPLLLLCYVAVIMWRSRAMPIIDLWFIARVPWKLLLPVRTLERPCHVLAASPLSSIRLWLMGF